MRMKTAQLIDNRCRKTDPKKYPKLHSLWPKAKEVIDAHNEHFNELARAREKK